MKFGFILLLLSITLFSYSQDTWKKTFTGDSSDLVFDVVMINDEIVMTGSTNSGTSGSEDILVMKINSLGDIVWSNIYGDTLDQSGLDILSTSDDGFLILGETMWRFISH